MCNTNKNEVRKGTLAGNKGDRMLLSVHTHRNNMCNILKNKLGR